MPVHMTDSAISKGFRDATENGERIELADSSEPGLRIRLTPPNRKTPSGKKVWVLCCRDRLGAMRRFPLGAFSEDGMGVSDARKAARALRLKVQDEGADPIADRRRDRAIGQAARDGEGTLKAALELYAAQKGATLKSWAHSRRRVDLVFRALMDRPAVLLTARDLQAVADSYPAQQSASFAVRTIRPALKWLAHRGHVPAALADLRQPATVQRRDRVLNREELGALLPALRASTKPHAAMLRFLLLTAARLNEAGSARWGDVDLNTATWTIRETKNKQIHVVPLSRQALTLLRSIKPKNAAATARIFATKSGAALGNWDRTGKHFMEASGVENWHRHDLRRTAATLTADLGVLPDIVEAMLNHVAIRSPLAATYNRSRYRPQVAAALQRLADELDGIETSATALVARRALTSKVEQSE
jgi:integrase